MLILLGIILLIIMISLQRQTRDMAQELQSLKN